MDYLLDYLKPTIFIYDEEFSPKVKESLARLNLSCIKHKLVFGNPSAANSVHNVLLKTQDISSFKPKDLSQFGSPSNVIACISFTSGSSGRPKAVPITSDMFVYEINGFDPIIIDSMTNVITFSSVRWISQLVLMFLPVFFNVRKTSSGLDVNTANISKIIHKRRPTAVFFCSSMCYAVMDYYFKSQVYDFNSVKLIICGGEHIDKSLLPKLQRMIPNVRLLKTYGMTECGGTIAGNSNLGSNINGGHLKKGFTIRIVDEDGSNVACEKAGMLQIKGPGVLPGYYKADDYNKEVFVDGWFITGDYGLVTKDNHLNMIGRFKDVLKYKGITIIPSLIEEHLNLHELVNKSFMISADGDIVFFVQLRKGVQNNLETKTELIDYVNKFVGTDIVAKLELIDRIQTLTSGKVDKMFYKKTLIGQEN